MNHDDESRDKFTELAFKVDVLKVQELRRAIKDFGLRPMARKEQMQRQLIEYVHEKNLDIGPIVALGIEREQKRKVVHPTKVEEASKPRKSRVRPVYGAWFRRFQARGHLIYY